jgi:hypothetical protein
MNFAAPFDPLLPQLPAALDGEAMAPLFARALDDDAALLGCEVESAKYRPRRNCSVSYRLTLQRAGRRLDQRVGARFCSGGDAARRHAKALARSPLPTAGGPALTHDATLDMVAHWLPNDPKLAPLRLLLDADALRRSAIDDVAAELGGGAVDSLAVELVQVVPELRACARVTLRRAGTEEQVLYAKCDHEHDGAATQRGLWRMAASAAQQAGELTTPRPLLWQPATGLHWQHAVAGVPLPQADPALGPTLSADVGWRLAALHAVPVPEAPLVHVDGLRHDLRRLAVLMAEALPACAPVIARIACHLDSDAPLAFDAPTVTLHGDLHPANVLVHAGRTAFVDLDSLRRGPAIFELGGWVADALYRAVLDSLSIEQALGSAAAFVGAWSRAARVRVDAEALAWSAAFHLLCRRGWRCLVNLKPGRLRALPALLTMAEAVLAAGSVDAAAELSREELIA